MTDALSLLPDYQLDQFDSRHRLVLVTAQRAKQLVQGARPAGHSKFAKEATVALDEVLHDQVKYLFGQEARDALKDAKRGRDAESERMAVVAGEDAQEIKKELSVYVDDSEKPPEPTEREE